MTLLQSNLAASRENTMANAFGRAMVMLKHCKGLTFHAL